MRTEKELWEVVLSRPDLFEYGLCHWLLEIWFEHDLEDDEYNLLDEIIDNSGIGYWIGEKSQIQPRIDWIKNRIETL